MALVSVNNLYKSYKKVNALDDINFEVNPGELFGFIGPDGAGKTSLFRIITTLILADKGNVSVLGYDVVKDYKVVRTKIGYMPGRFSLYQDLSVEENLNFFASVFGTTLQNNYRLIEPIYKFLEPFKKRRAGKLSGGMKQKLALCCALIHKPDLLVLDEPTTGVDPVSRNEFWDMLQSLKADGITTIVSTPYMDEAILCDKVALIQKGKLLSIDTPVNIVNKFEKKIFGMKSENMAGLIKALRQYEYIYSSNIFGEYIHYIDKRDKFELNEIEKYLSEAGIKNLIIKETKPGIEDCFIELMHMEN